MDKVSFAMMISEELFGELWNWTTDFSTLCDNNHPIPLLLRKEVITYVEVITQGNLYARKSLNKDQYISLSKCRGRCGRPCFETSVLWDIGLSKEMQRGQPIDLSKKHHLPVVG